MLALEPGRGVDPDRAGHVDGAHDHLDDLTGPHPGVQLQQDHGGEPPVDLVTNDPPLTDQLGLDRGAKRNAGMVL
jgi:hypothetical protein